MGCAIAESIVHRFCDLVYIKAVGHRIENTAVRAIQVIHLLVDALFHHPALIHYNDRVGVDDLRYAVGNNNDGAVFFYSINAVFYLFGGNGVQTGCGFIQKNNSRVFEKEARNGNPLLLITKRSNPSFRSLLAVSNSFIWSTV